MRTLQLIRKAQKPALLKVHSATKCTAVKMIDELQGLQESSKFKILAENYPTSPAIRLHHGTASSWYS